MATFKLKPQKVNASGTAPLQLWYFHKREYAPFVLGYSVIPTLVDIDGLTVSNKSPDADKINALIRTIITTCYKVLDNCAKSQVEPMPKVVRKMYDELLAAEAKQDENQKKAATGKKGLKVLTAMEADELDNAQKELDNKKVALKASEYYEASDSKTLEELLKMYDTMVYVKSEKSAESTMKIYKTFRDVYFFEFVNSKTYKEGVKRFGISIKPEAMTDTFSKVLLEFYAKEKRYKDNSIGKHIKYLKRFLGYLEIKGLPVCKEYRKWEHYEDEIDDFIIVGKNTMDEHGNDYDEFELLWNWRDNLKNPVRESKVFDLMVFGLLTGLRIGEILENEFVVFHRNGKDYLYGDTYKNDSEVMLPMWKDERLLYVLDKHNPQNVGLPKPKRIYKMNLCSDVEFNRISKQILKDLYEYHNINQYKIKQERTQLGKKVSLGEFYKWELFTSRTMRRSAITKWLNDWGLDEKQISALIGTKQLEVLEVYRKWDKFEKTKILEGI